MKSKKILWLFVLALILVGAAYWTKRTPGGAVGPAGTPLLPGLDVNSVAAIEIAEGGEILRLARLDDVWCVTNSFNYPADFGRLAQRLISLRDVKIGQVQRGMSLDAEDLKQVSFFDAQGSRLGGLTIGAGRQGASAGDQPYYRPASGRFLSRDGDKTVFLVKESLDEWNADASGWLDSEIINLSASDIAKIEIGRASGADDAGAPVVLDRSSGSLELVGLDEETEKFDSARGSGVDAALGYLRFNKIADPALTPAELGFSTGSYYRATLKSGEIYEALLGGGADGGRYLKLGVTMAPPTTNDAARLAAEARASAANAKLEPWTFLVSSYNAERMFRTRDELVKPKPVASNDVAAAGVDIAPAAETAAAEAAAAPAAAEPAVAADAAAAADAATADTPAAKPAAVAPPQEAK